MGAIAESESLLRRVVPDDQGFDSEDQDPKKVRIVISLQKRYNQAVLISNIREKSETILYILFHSFEYLIANNVFM